MRYKFFVYILISALIFGCVSRRNDHMVHINNRDLCALHKPVDIVVRVIGITSFTDEETNLPVGDVMKQSVENELKKIGGYFVSHNKGYLIGIEILSYNPRYSTSLGKRENPKISCSVEVCMIDTDIDGEPVIGEKLFVIPYAFREFGVDSRNLYALPFRMMHQASEASHGWRVVIEDCAKDICKSIDKVFTK